MAFSNRSQHLTVVSKALHSPTGLNTCQLYHRRCIRQQVSTPDSGIKGAEFSNWYLSVVSQVQLILNPVVRGCTLVHCFCRLVHAGNLA